MKIDKYGLTELKRCESYDNQRLTISVIWKTSNSNLIKLITKSYNCNHICEFYVFDKQNMKWNCIINPIDEVPFYEHIEYHIDSSRKLSKYRENEKRVLEFYSKMFKDFI